MKNNTTKKELKIVLSPELYDELRFTFRPAQLENIIYKPEIISETKWQCCCGSECELDVCPICGMEKHTVFSKVNPAYLARHRKARIAKRRKATQDKQALMAAQMLKKNQKQQKKNNKRLGTLIGIIFLCIAILFCFVIIFKTADKPVVNTPIDTTIDAENTNTPESTNTPAPTNTPDDTTTEPSTDTSTTPPTDTTTPAPVVPSEPVKVPSENTDGIVSTVADGTWPEGASGNTSIGGLVYTNENYDYIAKDGITVLDKSGNVVAVLTTNKALGITGFDKYIFYIDESNIVHRINTETNEDTAFLFKANSICAYEGELYYVSSEPKGLYASDVNGNTIKIISDTDIYTVNVTANKLYFSTDAGLCVLSSKDGNVKIFCPDGAKATSIIEITGCVFYTGTDGRLKFYNPVISNSFGVEYPRYEVSFTYVCAFNNRVYVKTVSQYTNAVAWISTTWTPGNALFAPAAFTSTGITTDALYVTSSAIYDGELNRTSIS